MLDTRVLAPIAYLGSFALAAPALESAFQQHGVFLSTTVCNVESGTLPTQLALCNARDALDIVARKALPPFYSMVSLSSSSVQSALHSATYSARFSEVLREAGSVVSQARIRSGAGAGAGQWLEATPIIPSLRFRAPLFVTALRVRLGLPHPCLANYVACASGHPLDPLGIQLLRCARAHFIARLYAGCGLPHHM